MSGNGEDDRGEAKPGKNPFLDEAGVPPVRQRKAKPPPNIISAGGVDMARAHASNIKLRDNTAPEPTLDQPRVVVAVELDPRKIPTHRRLIEGRDPADSARSAMLPGGAINATPPSGVRSPASARKVVPVAAVATAAGATAGGAATAAAAPPQATAPAPVPDSRKLPAWTRVAVVLALLLFVVGIAQRFRPHGDAVVDEGAPVRSPIFVTPPPPVEPAAPTAVATAPHAQVAPPPVAPAPTATATAATAAQTAKPTAQPARPPPVAPAPPRATFTPPFQLPGEKN